MPMRSSSLVATDETCCSNSRMNRVTLICSKIGQDHSQIELEGAHHNRWSLTKYTLETKPHLQTGIGPITRQHQRSCRRFSLQAAKSIFWSKESCKKLRTKAFKALLQI